VALRKSLAAAVMAVLLSLPHSLARASVPVEQIEPYETDTGDDPNSPTRYAPIDFGGQSQITLGPGQQGGYWNGITFHAEAGTTTTTSGHAYGVGQLFYGSNSVANPYVTDVYNIPALTFLTDVAQLQSAPSATGPLPGHFDGGAKIIDNAYVADATSNVDMIDRLDFMINRDDVTFVAAANNAASPGSDEVAWAAFNALAVSGNGFDPSSSQGKRHADLGETSLASFNEAAVAGYAAALYGHAQAASQNDALHGPVIRSLLMAGADKTDYVRQTSNNLDLDVGAGSANYNTSLAILNGGEKPIDSVNGGIATGTPSWTTSGWSYGSIAAGGQSAILFHSDGGLTGLTASLNWNVDQPLNANNANELDTTANPIFPNLSLELRPVTYVNGQATIGASYNNTTLASSTANDNVQYLYYTGSLPTGDYAFVITGDPSLSPNVGFSYTLTEPSSHGWTQAGGSWNTSGNWPGGVPNSAGATAAFATGQTTGGTVTLDGGKTVGHLVFDNAGAFTIAAGSGGSLTIDDTGDANGVSPSISVISGSHVISAPVVLANGIAITTTSSGVLTVSGNITGAGGLTSTGNLTLGGTDNFGDMTIPSGTVTLTAAASIANSNVTVQSGATLNAAGQLTSGSSLDVRGDVQFAANSNTGILARTLADLAVHSGGVVVVAAPSTQTNRTVLVTSELAFSGSSGAWQGQLDLTSNDMVVHDGNLADITSELKDGYTGAGGFWNGPGIFSSAAANNTALTTTLGVMSDDNGSGGVIYTQFDGQSVGISDVLVKYTYFGDTNLDGKLDSTDTTNIDNGFTNHLTGWFNGDFNYDGIVDGSDYSLLDNATNSSNGVNIPASQSDQVVQVAAETVSVPEPAVLVPLMALVFFAKRRK
jgi:hypothetical protein